MGDKRLAKIAKKWKTEQPRATWTAFRTLVRKMNINIAEAHWIKHMIL